MRRIKALLDFVRTTPANLLARANAVYAGLNGNPAYTRLPVDLSEFRAEIDGYAAAIAEALDGLRRSSGIELVANDRPLDVGILGLRWMDGALCDAG